VIILGGNASSPDYSWRQDPLLLLYSILMILPIIMIFAFYNHYGLDLLVWAGWALLVFSIAIIFMAGGEFRRRGGAPKGESIVHTTALVDTGIYALIRHPQYLGFMLFVLALMLMSQHWASVIPGSLGLALFYLDVIREERMSLDKFGDEYRRYMERVPRINILVGILRVLRRREENRPNGAPGPEKS
jgi:protein-S-isoprenylcysteine O-methyltransferase Ste14